ncbi:Erv1/Alr family FAD-linked sulfhydryl oxidase [Candidatus Poseidonia alphae]|nr:Erv1/Alr family FAD-linked sulfhydryl oxidase [Candidatus Poseidonia alphae]
MKTKKHGKVTSKQNKTKKKVFTTKNFNAPDGFLTSVWGPALWHSLHTISFNYPVNPTTENKKHYRDFMLNLVNILPCKYCRENLKNNYKQFPLTMECMKNRNSFSRYVFKLHETVNKMLGKKSGLTYCDIRERYEHFRARCTEEKPKMFKFKKTRKNKKEKGCTEPLYGKKAKCIIKIVPNDSKCKTFQIDKKCKKTKD